MSKSLNNSHNLAISTDPLSRQAKNRDLDFAGEILAPIEPLPPKGPKSTPVPYSSTRTGQRSRRRPIQAPLQRDLFAGTVLGGEATRNTLG